MHWSTVALSQYDPIDPILSRWAEAHSLVWLTVYQDSEVRTFFLNPNSRARVQVWVDPPHDGSMIVRVGQNQRGLSRLNRVENITCSVSGLSDALDKALEIGKGWLG